MSVCINAKMLHMTKTEDSLTSPDYIPVQTAYSFNGMGAAASPYHFKLIQFPYSCLLILNSCRPSPH